MVDHTKHPISYSDALIHEDTGKASLDVVILVHGTFACAEDDGGTRWWHRGSVFWKRLKTTLPSNIGMLDSQPLFKWSGENHYMSRYTAGIDLLTYLEEFEKCKTPYHIVAHSHGGTVLWNALRIAYWSAKRQRRRKPTSTCPFDLPHLRSCTAVATPFIRFKTLANPMLRLWVAEAVSLTITFGPPTAAVLALWPIAGLWALFALLSVLVFAPFGERSAFSTKFAAMQYLDAAVARSLGDRWLSLWSENDEAINLLRAANDVHIPVFKPPLPIVPYAHQNLFTKVFFFGHTLFIFLFDRYVVPLLNCIVAKRFAAFSLGLPFVGKVDDVSPFPCEEVYKHPTMADQTMAELKSTADSYLAKAAPTIRDALSRAAEGKDPNPLKAISLSDRELVHTSYFYNDTVVELIANHIAATSKRYGIVGNS